MNETNHSFELLEPTSPEALVPKHELWPWISGAIGIFLILTALWWILKKRKSKAIDPLAMRRAALTEARVALENITPQNSRDTAVLSSLILRKYLSTATKDPLLFETHEEFISRRDSLQSLTPEARSAAEITFSRLASFKYAPEIPSVEATIIVADSKKLLETLDRGFTA